MRVPVLETERLMSTFFPPIAIAVVIAIIVGLVPRSDGAGNRTAPAAERTEKSGLSTLPECDILQVSEVR